MTPEPTVARQDAFFRELVELSTDVVYRLDAAGVVTFMSGAVTRIFGYTVDEVVGRNIFDMMHPETRKAALARRAAKEEEREETSVYETLGLRKDGSTLWIEVTSTAVRKDGRLVAIQGAIRDISARRAALDALRGSDAKYRELVESASDIIYTHTLDGRFVDINEGALQAYGYTREEFASMKVQDLVLPEDLPIALQATAAKASGSMARTGPYPLRTRAKDGHVIPLEVTSRVVRDGDRTLVQGIGRDLTERQAAKATFDVLAGLAADVRAAPTTEDALHVLLERLAKEGAWTCGEAWAPAPDGKSLVLSPAWSGGTEPAIQRFRKLSQKISYGPGEGAIGRVWQTGTSVWLSDLRATPGVVRASAAAAAGLRAAAVLPLLDGTTVVAVLAFFAPEPRSQQLSWLRVAEQAAANAGMVLARRQAQDRLADALGLMCLQLGASPAAVLVVDASGNLVAANAAFAALCGTALRNGRPAAVTMGGGVEQEMEDPARFAERARDLYMGRGDLRQAGRVHERSIVDLRGDDGKGHGKLMVLRDVTAARETQESLRRLQQRETAADA